VEIFTPSLASKIFALLISTAALGWALFGLAKGRARRWAA
jgi:hypothetical protein